MNIFRLLKNLCSYFANSHSHNLSHTPINTHGNISFPCILYAIYLCIYMSVLNTYKYKYKCTRRVLCIHNNCYVSTVETLTLEKCRKEVRKKRSKTLNVRRRIMAREKQQRQQIWKINKSIKTHTHTHIRFSLITHTKMSHYSAFEVNV